MSFKENLLKKSNSYVYYKKNYESLKKQKKEDNDKISKLNREMDFNAQYIDFMNNDLINKRTEINNLQKDINLKADSIKFLENENNSKDELISKYEEEIQEYEEKIQECEELINLFEAYYIHNKGYKEFKDLNIAYVLRGFPIHSETFIISEVKWLKENGYNIVVFTNIDSYKPVDLDFDVKIERYNDLLELESLMIKYNIDLIHTHFVYPTCTQFTYPIAEKLKIPFTVFAHAYDIFVNENDRINKIDEISKSKYCKGIFTLSRFHKNYLMERGVKEEKIIITKQASDYEITPIQEKDNKIKKVIAISRFVEKKGLDVLIDAAKLLEDKDYEFSIYGFGDLKKDLDNQIEELGCTNIAIKEELPHNEVKNVLCESDLLVSPCKVAKNGDMDGFPTIIFESMAVGTPILTTAVSAIPEIIKDGVNGFITEPNNPKKIAEKIVEISEMTNEELYQIRLKAQEDVKNSSSVEKTMNCYVNLFKE